MSKIRVNTDGISELRQKAVSISSSMAEVSGLIANAGRSLDMKTAASGNIRGRLDSLQRKANQQQELMRQYAGALNTVNDRFSAADRQIAGQAKGVNCLMDQIITSHIFPDITRNTLKIAAGLGGLGAMLKLFGNMFPASGGHRQPGVILLPTQKGGTPPGVTLLPTQKGDTPPMATILPQQMGGTTPGAGTLPRLEDILSSITYPLPDLSDPEALEDLFFPSRIEDVLEPENIRKGLLHALLPNTMLGLSVMDEAIKNGSFYGYTTGPGTEVLDGKDSIGAQIYAGKAHGEFELGPADFDVNAYVGKVKGVLKGTFFDWSGKESTKYKDGKWGSSESSGFTIVEGKAGISADAIAGDIRVDVGDGDLGATGKASGSLGTGELKGSAEISYGEDGLNANLQGKGMISAAQGEASGTLHLGPFDVKLLAGGYLGALGAEGKVGIVDDQITAEAGIAAGLGGKVGVQVGLDHEVVEEIGDFIQPGLDTIGDFFDWVGDEFGGVIYERTEDWRENHPERAEQVGEFIEDVEDFGQNCVDIHNENMEKAGEFFEAVGEFGKNCVDIHNENMEKAGEFFGAVGGFLFGKG